MADQSTTDTGNVSEALITDQTTLEEALQDVTPAETETSDDITSEPQKEEAEEKQEKEELLLGKYKSVDDLKSGYNSLRDQHRKATEQLKELKQQLEGREIEKLKGASYDEQLDYLLNEIKAVKEFKETLTSQLQGQSEEIAVQQDLASIDDFIASNPVLKSTPSLAKQFRKVATHPDMQEYTLDSIYNVEIDPLVKELQGTKITTRERKVLSSKPAQVTNNFADVSKMSKSEYEKYRQEIFKTSGIK